MSFVAYLLRRLWMEARHAATSAGYWLRPYDMLADARRWRWRPRQRCGWSYGIGVGKESK